MCPCLVYGLNVIVRDYLFVLLQNEQWLMVIINKDNNKSTVKEEVVFVLKMFHTTYHISMLFVVP